MKEERQKRFQAALTLHRLFCEVQRQNKFVSTTVERTLKLLESHILLELEAQPGITAGQLAGFLCVDRRSVSKALIELSKRNLIKKKTDRSDARRQLLKVTTRAKSQLKRIDTFNNNQIEMSLKDHSASEQQAVRLLYKSISDGCNVPVAATRAGEHWLRPLQRRVTRALGLLTTRAFHSDLSAVSLHVLRTISGAGHPVSVNEIAAALGIKPSHLSQILSDFERKGYLKRNRSKKDQRIVLISESTKGRRKLKRVEESAAEFLLQALKNLSDNELRKCLAGYQKYVDSGSRVSRIEQPDIIRFSGDSAKLRGFFSRQLVRMNLEQQLPSVICGDRSVTYTAEIKGDITLAVHFLVDSDCTRLTCIAWTAALDHSPEAFRLFAEIWRKESKRSACLEQNIDEKAYKIKGLKRLLQLPEAE